MNLRARWRIARLLFWIRAAEWVCGVLERRNPRDARWKQHRARLVAEKTRLRRMWQETR